MQNNIGEESDPLLHKGAKELPSKDYDSLDYDVCYNVPYKRMISRYSKFTYLHVQLMKWVLVGIIGMMTGLVAFMIDACVKYLFKLKFSVFEKVYNASLDSGSVAISLLVLLGFNCSFVVIAALMTVWEPVAAGSGIPEIKCYLNGVKVPHVTRVSTLVAKASGVLFSVSGGLFVGKEGPMIHSGAILGAGISQLRSMLPFLKKLPIPYPHFRSDRDKRDFVSSGAAAGVAAAFGAPIGGVLFSLEEGSSFWNQSLTWRTLFCSFSATFTLNFFLSGTVIPNLHWGELGQGGLVDFGVFNNQQRDAWTAWHVIIFVLLGVIGGLAGALFNSINTSITVYRMKHLQRRTWKGFWKVMEVILIASVTTVCVFGLSMSLSRCIPVSGNVTLLQTKYETKNFFCPTDTGRSYINDMATVLFNSEESAIKQFFHLTDSFTLTSLWFLCVLYFIIACWTYGAGVPSGLFIPCLAVGATYGRLIANFINYYNIPFFNTLYPASYALLGAASFLGGVVRMTISLTVIIIEATNEINYGLPILITIMVSKWIGDLFNHGLYDVHIELRRTPMLGWDSPERMDRLASADVMAEKLSYVYPITRVSSVVQLLRTTYFSAFPVVTPFQNFQAKPQNVSGKHIPGLYSSRQFISLTDYDLDSDADTCRSDSAFVEVMSPNARHAKKEESTDSTVTITPTNKDAPIHSRVNSYGAVAVDYHPFDPGELRQSEGEEEEENVFPHYPLLFHDSRKASLSYTLADTGLRSSRSSLQQEDTRVFKQPLVLHGIILRSQLITLLRNKVFFDEEYGAESQKELPHADMIEDYPRYKTIYDVSLTSEEKKKLMDLSVYMNPCPYTISNQAPLPQVFNLFRTMGLRHLPVVQDFGILIGMITRHDLTHERLQQARYMKRRKDRQKAREQRSLRSTAKL